MYFFGYLIADGCHMDVIENPRGLIWIEEGTRIWIEEGISK